MTNLFRYKYLKSRFEELIDERDKYSSELSSILKPPGKKNNSNKNSKSTEKEYDLDIKKLYRQITVYVHPDKGGSDEEFNKLKEAYYYRSVLDMLDVAYENNVDYDTIKNALSVNSNKIEDELSDVENSIEHLNKTAPMIWGRSNENDKEKVEEWLIKNHNFEKIKKDNS